VRSNIFISYIGDIKTLFLQGVLKKSWGRSNIFGDIKTLFLHGVLKKSWGRSNIFISYIGDIKLYSYMEFLRNPEGEVIYL